MGHRVIMRRASLPFMAVMIASFIMLFFTNGKVYAGVKNDKDIYALSVFMGVEECYNKYALDKVDKIHDGAFEYKIFFNTVNKKPEGTGFTFGDEHSESIWVPTHVGNGLVTGRREDSNLSCKQVFEGYEDKALGVKDYSNGKFPPNDIKNGYVAMGYDGDTSGESAKWKFNISVGNSLSLSRNDLFITIGEKLDNYPYYKAESCSGQITFVMGSSGSSYSIACALDGDNRPRIFGYEGSENVEDYIKNDSVQNVLHLKTSVYDLCPYEIKDNTYYCVEPTKESIQTMMEVFSAQILGGVFSEIEKVGFVAEKQDSTVVSGYKLPNGGDGAKVAAQRMLFQLGVNENLPNTSVENRVSYTWNNAYRYALYYYYLNEMISQYPSKIFIGGEGKCGAVKDGSWTYAFRNAESSSDDIPAWCEISFSDGLSEEEKNKIMDTFFTVPTLTGMEPADFRTVLGKKMPEMSYDGMTEADYARVGLSGGFLQIGTAETEQSTAAVDQGENASGTAAATCQSSGGAGAVGWIVCPILEWMGNSATHLYTDYVEPRLKINPKLFQTLESGNENPTQNAWGTFQTIANVVFIILLLVVIFSQLTGIGIDNYGIKRILPKLIVVAILVNLSYLICVICVDLSNILGGSLKGLFDSLGASLGDIAVDTGVASTPVLGNDSWIPVVLFGILVTFIIVGAASVVFNPAILLTLLISGLGVVISVLFIFVLFAVREAVIVVLTVVAPIAFVCYALPNTKKMFDKWLKAWEGLLLVYPICGLLIGGGDYISRLLITVEGAGTNETGFFPLMTAMVVGIAPIFFIPSLLKGSFAAMGNIGAKVSGIGKTLGGKATGRLANSGVNKRLQQKGAERAEIKGLARRAGMRLDKDGHLVERTGRISGMRRRIAQSGFGRATGMNRTMGEAMSQLAQKQIARDDAAAMMGASGAGVVAAQMANAENARTLRMAEGTEAVNMIDPSVAAANVRAKRSAERTKMYNDNFAGLDKGGVENELRSALGGRDSERTMAALSTLVSKGGVDEAFRALEGADWKNMDVGVRSSLIQTMGGTNIDAMKSFSKYLGSGGQASFKEWSSGTGTTIANEANNANIKDKTLAAHLSEVGENATVGYSKDEMQLLERNASNLATGMGAENFATTVANTSINSKDAKAQNVAEDIIAQGIAAGNFEADKMGINANKLSNARDRLAESIQTGYERRIANNNPKLSPVQVQGHANAAVRQRLAAPIQGVKADVRAVNRMSPGTRRITGV